MKKFVETVNHLAGFALALAIVGGLVTLITLGIHTFRVETEIRSGVITHADRKSFTVLLPDGTGETVGVSDGFYASHDVGDVMEIETVTKYNGYGNSTSFTVAHESARDYSIAPIGWSIAGAIFILLIIAFFAMVLIGLVLAG